MNKAMGDVLTRQATALLGYSGQGLGAQGQNSMSKNLTDSSGKTESINPSRPAPAMQMDSGDGGGIWTIDQATGRPLFTPKSGFETVSAADKMAQASEVWKKITTIGLDGKPLEGSPSVEEIMAQMYPEQQAQAAKLTRDDIIRLIKQQHPNASQEDVNQTLAKYGY